MILSPFIPDIAEGKQKEKALAPLQPIAIRRYRQMNTLADISLGRIRRWGLPFRRPFSL
ncbi:hypothetical protein OKW21_006082 [Catalinimonas alkaloidigena]|uniref:hypothetical protein n=1 Tax=Catalinimonas alkaloidigena TaxID=1075417 RepID=UPI0024049F8A|nr:hypothetical protein [Catalinimonas alkaloidigena]MDF9800819.1 hypothetical protein [Catalinimonas alkaloidigena]